MKHKLFSIFDDKAAAYLPPFLLPTVGMAKRVFADCVNSDNHQFGTNPGDYTLFELGEFDDSTGHIETRAAHLSLGNGLVYKRRENNDLDAPENESALKLISAGGTE